MRLMFEWRQLVFCKLVLLDRGAVASAREKGPRPLGTAAPRESRPGKAEEGSDMASKRRQQLVQQPQNGKSADAKKKSGDSCPVAATCAVTENLEQL